MPTDLSPGCAHRPATVRPRAETDREGPRQTEDRGSREARSAGEKATDWLGVGWGLDEGWWMEHNKKGQQGMEQGGPGRQVEGRGSRE